MDIPAFEVWGLFPPLPGSEISPPDQIMVRVVDPRFRNAFGECKKSGRFCLAYQIDTTLNVPWKYECSQHLRGSRQSNTLILLPHLVLLIRERHKQALPADTSPLHFQLSVSTPGSLSPRPTISSKCPFPCLAFVTIQSIVLGALNCISPLCRRCNSLL